MQTRGRKFAGTTIARAHEAGLQVHAWINVNLVASAVDLPAAREHVIYRHPEWLMVPRALADELSNVDPRSRRKSRACTFRRCLLNR